MRVVGTTTADALLLKDTLQTIAQFAAAKFGCYEMGTVSVKVLPGYIPANEAYRTDDATAYERWDVELCEKTQPFLITFAPEPQGGVIFKIGYPPPEDLPPPYPVDQ